MRSIVINSEVQLQLSDSNADSVDPAKVQPNLSKTSIHKVPGIFIVKFRLICWESQVFVPIKRKACLQSASDCSELNCVKTGLNQLFLLLNFAISY